MELRLRKPIHIKSVRPMVEADIESLRQPSARLRIVKLRESHHILARLLASGLTHTAAASHIGYTQSRVSILANTPAVQDLIAKYRATDDASWKESRDEYYESVHAAGTKAWRQINDQLDDVADDDPLPLDRLLRIADSSADRVGYHKKSASINVNIDFASKLESAIARSRTVRQIELEE